MHTPDHGEAIWPPSRMAPLLDDRDARTCRGSHQPRGLLTTSPSMVRNAARRGGASAKAYVKVLGAAPARRGRDLPKFGWNHPRLEQDRGATARGSLGVQPLPPLPPLPGCCCRAIHSLLCSRIAAMRFAFSSCPVSLCASSRVRRASLIRERIASLSGG